MGTTISLFGLLLEMIAGLMLAADALGLKRIALWNVDIKLFWKIEPDERGRVSRLSRWGIPIALSPMLIISLLIGNSPLRDVLSDAFNVIGEHVFPYVPQRWAQVVLALAAFAGIGIIALIVSCMVTSMFLEAIRSLIAATLRHAKQGRAAAEGFALFTFGCLFQFVGTMVQSLH